MKLLPKKTESITIKVDAETKAKIDELVLQNKTSQSTELRKMIDYYFDSLERLKK